MYIYIYIYICFHYLWYKGILAFLPDEKQHQWESWGSVGGMACGTRFSNGEETPRPPMTPCTTF